jgi:FkbM family methyltransferase
MLNFLKRKLKERAGVPSTVMSLKLIHKNGFKPNVIYDIGAYKGEWTKEVISIFPSSSFYMFEGQVSKEGSLNKITKLFPDQVKYHIGLLGAISGEEVIFHEYETASSVHSEYYKTEAVDKISYLQTLDEVLQKWNWPLPDFIKLDTQGYEIEILKGGSKSLLSAELILMEVSFLEIYKGAPLFHDVISQMSEWGFQVYDICTLMRRPLDQALYQADVLFVKSSSELVASKKWA